MLTEVTGALEPLSDAWIDQLDAMPKQQALEWVHMHLRASIDFRNQRELSILNEGCTSAKIHAWCIDNNNIIRFKRLHEEIESEC